MREWEKLGRWICIVDKLLPIDKLLPKEGQDVIYYFDKVGVHCGKYVGMTERGPQFKGLNGFLTGDVTHWMRLPDAPSLPAVGERRNRDDKPK